VVPWQGLRTSQLNVEHGKRARLVVEQRVTLPSK